MERVIECRKEGVEAIRERLESLGFVENKRPQFESEDGEFVLLIGTLPEDKEAEANAIDGVISVWDDIVFRPCGS